jgi:hypothetical protein
VDEESSLRRWLRRASTLNHLTFLPVLLRWCVSSHRVITIGLNGLLTHVDLGTGDDDVVTDALIVAPYEISAL